MRHKTRQFVEHRRAHEVRQREKHPKSTDSTDQNDLPISKIEHLSLLGPAAYRFRSATREVRLNIAGCIRSISPILGPMRAPTPRSLLCFNLGPVLILLSDGFASGRRIRFGEDICYRAADDTHAHALGDVDADLVGTVDAHHRSDDAPASHHPITPSQRIECRPVLLRLLLLWPDQQEIKDDKDQYKWQELQQR